MFAICSVTSPDSITYNRNPTVTGGTVYPLSQMYLNCGKGFQAYGKTFNASTRSFGVLQQTGEDLKIVFSYTQDVHNCKIFVKEVESGGTTAELDNSYISIATDKRSVTVTIPSGVEIPIYWAVMTNGDFGNGQPINYKNAELVNCSNTFTGDYLLKNMEQLITLTADDGYIFEDSNKPYWDNITNEFTLSTDRKTATAAVTPTNNNIIVFYGTAVQDFSNKTLNITGVFSNCSCNYTNGEPLDPTKDVVITANSNYSFLGTFHYLKDGTQTEIINNTTELRIPASVFASVSTNITLNDTYSASLTTYTLEQSLANCTSSVSGTTIQYELNKLITLTASNYHKFLTPPTISISGDSYNFTVSEDKNTATITKDITGNVSITGTGTAETYTLTQTLTNCTSSVSGTTIQHDPIKTITLTANTGYSFTEPPIIKINGVSYNFNVSSDKKTATTSRQIIGNVEITGTATKDPVYYTLTQTLTNCTSSVTGDVIAEETGKIITLTANTGYIFVEHPTLTSNGVDYSFTISEEGNKATIITDINANITISGTAVKNQRILITGTFINCSCNYSHNDILDPSKDVIITADDGYEFKGDNYFIVTGNFTETFNKSLDNKTLYKSSSSLWPGNYELNDTYRASRVVEQIGSFTNLYSTNQTELTNLSRERFLEVSGDSYNLFDYGQFINALYIIPFELPSELLDEEKSAIILGTRSSDTLSTQILTYLYEFSGGTVTVPEKYNNIHDYVNTECIIHFPLLQSVYVESEYVIGQTLEFFFTIDLYSSLLTIDVKSSFNNEVIKSVSGLIGLQIPHIVRGGSFGNRLSQINSNINKRCFIEVKRNIPYTKGTSVLGGAVVEFGTIGDYAGYLECDNLIIETRATVEEQQEIKQLLKNGIFL